MESGVTGATGGVGSWLATKFAGAQCRSIIDAPLENASVGHETNLAVATGELP
ncbi:hypothetical protein [Natrialba chahannaoensis]|uniref:hypothetical protein n=1 Tax=Natrialba chahannaoensis TaxID=68911 RepID=UPI000AD28995|nr:hypothetical protein [Natrialba chahannaoensis]